MTSTSCNRCRAETNVTTINFADGEADSLRLRLKDFPLRQCVEGHRQFVRPDFAAGLLQHLTEEDEPELPAGEDKGSDHEEIPVRKLRPSTRAKAGSPAYLFDQYQAGESRPVRRRSVDAGVQMLGLR